MSDLLFPAPSPVLLSIADSSNQFPANRVFCVGRNYLAHAKEMGISERTLQRRLAEEGSSFSKVLDELRRDLADEFLVDRNLAVSEVAFLLGYSEPSTFYRAFRRWHDVSPREFRAATL